MRLTQLTKITTVAGVLAAPLAVAGPASSATTGAPDSAYGIAATGLVPIAPLPSATSASQPNHKSLLELPANPLVQAKVLSAAATPGKARASVADLRVAQIALSAHLITAKCVNGKGNSLLTKVVLNGQVLKTGAAPNSAVTVGLDKLGSASVIVNKQVRDSYGRLTVTAVELSVPLGPGKVTTISIASATCGAMTAPTPPGAAPVPTPVTGNLPVTG
jgi:hypothetical protein